MLKTIIVGITISLVIIIIPLNDSFSQSYNQTSDDAVIVVADSPETKANLDRFDQLDFDDGIIEIGHFFERYIVLMYWSWIFLATLLEV